MHSLLFLNILQGIPSLNRPGGQVQTKVESEFCSRETADLGMFLPLLPIYFHVRCIKIA